MPLSADVFGICSDCGERIRHRPRRMDGAAPLVALSSLSSRRLRSRTRQPFDACTQMRFLRQPFPRAAPVTMKRVALHTRQTTDRNAVLAEIKNPNQQGGGGQDSRTILIFTGIFLVLFLGLQYFKKKEPEPPAVQQHAASTSAASPQHGGERRPYPATTP